MKPRWSFFSLAALLAALLALFASSASVTASAVQATAPSQKVIAPAGVLTEQAGVTLWHDYGAFALYQVTDEALAALPTKARTQLQIQSADMDTILLDAYPFNTQRDTLNAPAELTFAKDFTGASLQLIQFVGPIKQTWLDEISASGVVPIHYIANNAYLVWADDAGRKALNNMAAERQFLQYSGLYQPFFKFGPTLRDRNLQSDELINVTVQMIRHENSDATEALVQELFVSQIAPWQPILAYQNIIGTMRLSDVTRLAQQPDVYWIGERLERERFDEIQNQIIAGNFNGDQSGPSGPGYLAWLQSYGFSTTPADYPVVDVVDDGVGTGSVNSGDRTFHVQGNIANATRLSYVSSCAANPSGEGPDGHGHINASIVGGYDTTGGFPFTDPNGYLRGLGVNPFARMASTRIFAPGYDISGCGGTDTGVILHSYTSGARISTNSWGCSGCAGSYDDGSQAYDVGVRDADLTAPGNQELMILFAAGNSGSGAGTVGTPGNGKNMLTVGASENQRPTDEDGNWTDGCLVGPTGADDAMDIIDFSSRGPAPGNRVKPEVIAPGTHIQGTASTNASYNGSGVCDQFRPSGQTTFAASSGTSHSTPAVAGVSSLVYYWLQNEQPVAGAGGGYEPSPAAVKAYIMNHPTYLTGVSANDTLPSNAQGYGMPNLGVMFDETPKYVFDQGHIFDNTGETWVWNGAVADPSKPVRIMMVYTDQAGAIGTSPQVNNLNLAATIGGTPYLGNRFAGQWSVTGGTADNLNNYEAVFLPAGTAGPIQITITAANIAGDGVPNVGDGTDQDFALVCYNCAQNQDFTLVASPSSLNICTPNNAVYDVAVGSILGYVATVNLSASGNPAGTTATFGTNSGTSPFDTTLTIGNTGAASFGSYDIAVTGMGPTSTYTSTVGLNVFTAVPSAPTPSVPTDGESNVPLRPSFSWSSVSQNQGYVVEVATDMAFSNIVYTANVAGTSHTMSGFNLDPESTYYWRARANNICGDGTNSAVYSFTTVLLFCSYPDLGIVDNQTVSDSLIVNRSEVISDLDVYVRLDHTYVGDLVVTLHNDATATSVELIPASFSCGNDDVDATFDDEATNPLTCGASTPTISGLVQPFSQLSAFDFSALTATWRLSIQDTAGGDEGTLQEWCLVPSFATAVGTAAGTVTDANTNQPIAGATLSFTDGVLSYTAVTDASGDYTRSLPTGTFTTTTSATNYVTAVVAGVSISDGVTTDLDFVLDAGELASSATQFTATVNLGDSDTANWNISNTGTAPADIEIRVRDIGYAPSLFNQLAGEDILIVNDGGFNTSQANAMATAVNNLGYTYAIINSATFVATDVADLLNYQAVLYAGLVSEGTEQAKAIAYMDAGGRFLVADNDLGWGTNGTPFYDTYLQADYLDDEGSDGVINGVDIMAGLTTDISSDPFPDDFAVLAEGVGIFVAPSGNWAGSRVERNDYKAIYFAWDYHYAGGAAVGDPIETDIMAEALGWLLAGNTSWLSTDVVTATLGVGGDVDVVVTMSAAQVALPGDYFGELVVVNNTPYGDLVVPVTMTVECPNCGTVAGTITDALTGDPVVGSIQITDTNGFDVTLEGSSYSFPLLPGTYTLNASAAGYFGDTAVVTILTGQTTTQNFPLTPIFAALLYSPAEIEEDMEIGDVVTNTVTVTNTGTSPLDFSVAIGEYAGPNMVTVQKVESNTNHNRATTSALATFDPLQADSANASLLEKTEPQTPATPASLTAFNWPTNVLYDNGPLVNCAGCGAGGADVSSLQTALGLDSFGIGHQQANGNRVADDFVVPAGGWTLDTITFFAYQTGSSTTSTITGVNLRIWDGSPDNPASNIVFGDTTTNRMISTGWSNIYRTSDTALTNVDRPIMASVVDMEGLFLPQGTYWVDWQSHGSLASGPWAPPITINGETTTGNALQFTNGAWQAVEDGGTFTPQGLPFVIEGAGTAGPTNWAVATPNSGTVAAGETATFAVVFDATGIAQEGTFTAELSFSGNFVNTPAPMPLTMNITCPTCGTLDGAITDADTGDPLVADVTLTGNGVNVATTGSTYQFAVPAGTYTVTVAANGYVGDTAVVTVNTNETVTTDFALRADAPNLSTTPTELRTTLVWGTTATQTLTIHNNGAAGTDYTLSEIPVFGQLAQRQADVVADGSFEANPATGPWVEHDSTGCIPWIGDWSSIVGVTAHDGVQYFWAGGGCNSAANSNSAAQTITIPSGTATLTFWYQANRTDADDPVNNGQAYVQLDGNNVWTLVTNQAANTMDWTEVSVDVSAYAGQTVELKLGLTQGASGFANVFFDSVSLDTLADVPWLATDPTQGTLAADSSTDVAVLFDTTVFTQTGMFSAILRLQSDDPASPLDIPVYITVTAPSAAIALDVTVSTANECGTAESLVVPAGSVVYFCYSVENMGNLMLPSHTITDTDMGMMAEFEYDLMPGMRESVVISHTVTDSMASVATWTATHAGLSATAVATDDVAVYVNTPGVLLLPDVDNLAAPAGTTLTYTLHLTNEGTLPDTFTISLAGQTWQTTAPTSINLDGGSHTSFTVVVQIPANANGGDDDSVTVTATSSNDPSVTASAMLTSTAVVTSYNLYLPLIAQP